MTWIEEARLHGLQIYADMINCYGILIGEEEYEVHYNHWEILFESSVWISKDVSYQNQ